MNDVNQSKNTVMKLMAVVGFIAILIFGVWLAVQVVRVIPNAFTSLASIADGVYNNRPVEDLVVSSNETILNSGESFTISWTDVKAAGTYQFAYVCTDGVAVDVRNKNGAITSIDCDTPVNLGSDVNTLEVQATSEKRRFSDVSYEITFMPEANNLEDISKNGRFTLVNSSIPQSAGVVEEETDTDDEVVVTTPTKPVNPPVTTPPPTVTETPIYAIPTSDPNGFTDLAVKFLGVGTMDNKNRFTQSATIKNGDRGAFQFEVKNLGTKTSSNWEFEATLTSGTKYDSKNQAALKPNERAVITLGFDAVGKSGFQTFGVEISGGNDRSTSNNDFTWAVEVKN